MWIPDVGHDTTSGERLANVLTGVDSIRTYPLFVKGDEAKVPPKNRKMRIDAVFLERAAPTWNPT